MANKTLQELEADSEAAELKFCKARADYDELRHKVEVAFLWQSVTMEAAIRARRDYLAKKLEGKG